MMLQLICSVYCMPYAVNEAGLSICAFKLMSLQYQLIYIEVSALCKQPPFPIRCIRIQVMNFLCWRLRTHLCTMSL